jgi:hypothetical protein
MIRTKSRVKTGSHDVFRTGRRARGNDQHPPAWWKPERLPRSYAFDQAVRHRGSLFNRLSAILPRASDTAFIAKPDFYHFVFFCGFLYGPPSLAQPGLCIGPKPKVRLSTGLALLFGALDPLRDGFNYFLFYAKKSVTRQ